MTPAPPAPLVVGPITLTDVVRYQGASGDWNPIHHDAAFAAAAGFPQPLVVGMYPAGLLATWAAEWLGPEAVRSFRVRFAEQVWPGDTLTCTGAVVAERACADGRLVDVELVCTRQTGGVAVHGWATFLLVADGRPTET